MLDTNACHKISQQQLSSSMDFNQLMLHSNQHMSQNFPVVVIILYGSKFKLHTEMHSR